MAHFELRISGDVQELGEIAAALGGTQQITVAQPGPAPVDAAGLTAAEKPKRATRKGDKPEEGSTTDATAASPATELPTPAIQQTVEQQKAVDPDVLAAQNGGGPVNTSPAPAEEPVVEEQPEETTSTPSATAPGDVTMDDLKALLSQSLSETSAKASKEVLDKFGVGRIGEAKPEQYAEIAQALRDHIAAAKK